jgi:membrane dipeptidase
MTMDEESFPVIDGHYDRVLKFFTSFSNPKNSTKSAVTLPMLRKGNVQAALFAVPGMKTVLIRKFLSRWFKLINDKKNELYHIRKFDDFKTSTNLGKIGAVLSCEGAGGFPNDFKLLDNTIKKGLRVLGLCWKPPNRYAFSWANKKTEDSQHLGITEDGFRLIKKVQTHGITIDVSHLGDDGFWDLIEYTKKPIMATHSNSRTISNHRRNLMDEQIKAIAENGGTIGINFWTNVLDPNRSHNNYTLGFDTIKKHMDQIIKIGGIETLALGTDFDGASTPHCVPNSACYPSLFLYLMKNGYNHTDIEKISSQNILRVFKETW